MKLSHGVAAVILLASATAAHAELSGTITAVSDYDFRGISLSAEDPALQGSIDYAFDNGIYLGAWASNIDYGKGVDGNIELDLYGGYAWETESFGFDAGIVWYTYPDSSSSGRKEKISDYPEVYFGLSYEFLEVMQWYTWDYGGTSEDAFYTEGNVGFDLPANFSIGAHLGYNYGDAFKNTEYWDYSIGVGYSLANFDFELKWVDTSLSRGDDLFSSDDVFNSEGRVVFGVSTTFPWGDE